jgi:uncharacterized heparinase superfamily protein
MYHLIVLADVLDIINLCRACGRNAPEHCYIAAAKMLSWACEMQHPDGNIPFFNDAAANVAPTAAELERYAKQLGINVNWTTGAGESCFRQESGYVKLANRHCTVFFDVAPVGPDYLPGHGHADTLSIEVSVGSQRVLVNSGTSLYADRAERYQQRSTAAHNTIEIDGTNSSEIWGSFRVGRRAYPYGVQFSAKEGRASAYHDGYRFLRGTPVHHRALTLENNLLRIHDRIEGRGTHDVIGRFHLHPNVSVEGLRSEASNHRCILKQKDTGKPCAEFVIDRHVSVSFEKTSYHPEFGLSLPNDSIVFCYQGHLPSDIESQLQWHD